MSEKHRIIPVWFFVGVLLLVYGILIFISGLVEWSHPPDTVLAETHAPVWWGALLIVLGSVYCLMFRPGKELRD
jgi:FtsH-binding integral membrane protein